MPDRMLERVVLKGFKTFRALDLELRPVNVLIGANGAGKSNFISLFKMLNRMMEGELGHYVMDAGGANTLLHYGRKVTDQIDIELWFRQGEELANGYQCRLVPVSGSDSLAVLKEAVYFHNRSKYDNPYQHCQQSGVAWQPQLPQWAREPGNAVARFVYEAMLSWRVYHFHDTSDSARVKMWGDIHDNRHLLADAANLAAFLYMLREKHPRHYENIVATVRLAAPFFGDFILRPGTLKPGLIRLAWRERGSDLEFGPNLLSDGTLRFICLATLFLQPPEYLPATIILDEPELGLHPYAVRLLAEMVHSVAGQRQVILATQSVTLVNQFALEDIVVVDRPEGVSTARRLEGSELQEWLEDYRLGDLWEKNVLGGGPTCSYFKGWLSRLESLADS